MICKIHVVTIGEDGREETREITSIQRTDVKPETLGLTLAEGKMILKDLQQVVVESQVSSLLLPKRTCPECGEPRCSKGNHTLSVRTVFGRLTVRSPRLYHCVCRPHDTKTFSPLAELLPNHTLPELLFLETKWASLMSYGMTSKLFQISVAEAEHADFANGKENRDTNQPVHCCANRWFQKERDTFDMLYSVSQDQRAFLKSGARQCCKPCSRNHQHIQNTGKMAD